MKKMKSKLTFGDDKKETIPSNKSQKNNLNKEEDNKFKIKKKSKKLTKNSLEIRNIKKNEKINIEKKENFDNGIQKKNKLNSILKEDITISIKNKMKKGTNSERSISIFDFGKQNLNKNDQINEGEKKDMEVKRKKKQKEIKKVKNKKIKEYNLPSKNDLIEDISISMQTKENVEENEKKKNYEKNIFDKNNMILSPINSCDNLNKYDNSKKDKIISISFDEELEKSDNYDFFSEKFFEKNSFLQIRINSYKLSFNCENKYFVESDDLKKFKTINISWKLIQEKKDDKIDNEVKKDLYYFFQIDGKELFNLNSGSNQKIRSPPIQLETTKTLKIVSILNLEELCNFYLKLNIQINKSHVDNLNHYQQKKKKIEKKLKQEIIKFFHSIFSQKKNDFSEKSGDFFGKITKEYIYYFSKDKKELQEKIIASILNPDLKEKLIDSSNFLINNLDLWSLDKNNEFYNIELEEKYRKMKLEEVLLHKDLNKLIQFIVNENKSYLKYVFDNKGINPFYFINYDSRKVIFKIKNGNYIDFEDKLEFIAFFTKDDSDINAESQYYKLLAHFVQITKSIQTNIFVNFNNLNLVSMKKFN